MYSVVLMMALSGSADVPACHHRHGCCGCSGYSCCGCYGYSCCGCWGGCSGCWGGCYGCWGGCWGGCYGYSCCGCWGGGYVDGGAGYYGAPPVAAPGGTERKRPEEAPAPRRRDEGRDRDQGSMGPAPATIVVSLPAGANLIVDGKATRSRAAKRVFVSPALERNTEYFYTLKAEVVEDGRAVTSTRRVAVRAGQETRVSFDLPVSSLALR